MFAIYAILAECTIDAILAIFTVCASDTILAIRTDDIHFDAPILESGGRLFFLTQPTQCSQFLQGL